jgi:hypothetical protein
MGPMRQGLAAIVALTMACAACAVAAGNSAPAPSAPAVVAGVPVTTAQARARAGSKADTYEVREALVDLVRARFVAAEAALRGVSTNPDYLARALAAEQSSWGGEAAWRTYLRGAGIAESESRAAIADQALGATLTDDITDAAHGDAQAWGRAFDEAHARWRAQTTCSATIARRIPDWCGNTPARLHGCKLFGVGELCAFGGSGAPSSPWPTSSTRARSSGPATAKASGRGRGCATISGARRRASCATPPSTSNAARSSSRPASAPTSSWPCTRSRGSPSTCDAASCPMS